MNNGKAKNRQAKGAGKSKKETRDEKKREMKSRTTTTAVCTEER